MSLICNFYFWTVLKSCWSATWIKWVKIEWRRLEKDIFYLRFVFSLGTVSINKIWDFCLKWSKFWIKISHTILDEHGKTEAPLGFSFQGVQSNVSKIWKSTFSEIKSLKVPNSGGSMDPPAPFPQTEPLKKEPFFERKIHLSKYKANWANSCRVTAITTTSEQLGTTDNGNNLDIQVNNLPLQK